MPNALRRARRFLLGLSVVLTLVSTTTLTSAAPVSAVSVIEGPYRVRGPWATSTTTGTDAGGRGFVVFHPSDLGANGVRHPIITWANGSGSTPAEYTATLSHLASWGFVVVASSSGQTGYGTEVWAATQAMIRLDSTSGSTFYGKLDPAKVGAAGHSQGATGAVNATVLSNGVIISTAAVAFVDPFWFRDRTQMPDWSRVDKPLFFVSATGDWLATQAQQTRYYNGISGPTVRAAIRGGGHNTIKEANTAQLGYFTAWFLYTLAGDATALQAFVGSPPELNGNAAWTNAAEKNLT